MGEKNVSRIFDNKIITFEDRANISTNIFDEVYKLARDFPDIGGQSARDMAYENVDIAREEFEAGNLAVVDGLLDEAFDLEIKALDLTGEPESDHPQFEDMLYLFGHDPDHIPPDSQFARYMEEHARDLLENMFEEQGEGIGASHEGPLQGRFTHQSGTYKTEAAHQAMDEQKRNAQRAEKLLPLLEYMNARLGLGMSSQAYTHDD